MKTDRDFCGANIRLAGVPASLSLGMSMHQGAIFGVVSTVAVEAHLGHRMTAVRDMRQALKRLLQHQAMQLGLAQKRGAVHACAADPRETKIDENRKSS